MRDEQNSIFLEWIMKLWTMIGIILIIMALVSTGCVSTNQNLSISDDPVGSNQIQVEKTPQTLIVPGKSHFGAAEEYLSPESGKIEAGKNIVFELRIEKNKESIRNETIKISRVNGKYSEEELPLPDGMTINCTPSSFISYPEKVYNVSIILTTGKQVPADTYSLRIQRYFDSGITTMWADVQILSPANST
jgi:hypothetical protein